ncbi:MAG: GNAT family N-acetyltransferase [Dehalococcoidia bacterium]
MAVTDEALRAIAHEALAIAHAPQGRYKKHGRREEREGVMLSSGDIPGPIFNKAVALSPTASADHILAIAEAFFAGAAAGFGLMVEAEANPALESGLRSRGWQIIDEGPAMVLPSLPARYPPLPLGLELRTVTDQTLLDEFFAVTQGEESAAEIGNEDAGSDHSVLNQFIPANVNQILIPLACALDPDVALFVGYVDGTPVAHAALYRTNGVAEIGSVDVRSSQRRRGYGTALTWAAIKEGAARGCTAAALRATEMGYSVYRRMGFLPTCRFRTYWDPGRGIRDGGPNG